jgi:UDP-glucose:(heptosyl)LPS alpha-1,3-glucosyltransferase
VSVGTLEDLRQAPDSGRVDPPPRPTIGLVAHNVHSRGGMERACVELIRRASSSYRFVVFTSELTPELRDVVDWERIRVPPRPFPLRYLAFAAVAGWRLRRVHTDLVHTLGALVPNRVDVAIVHSCHAAFRANTGKLAPPDRTPLRRVNTSISRLLALGAERWSYRPGKVRLLTAVSEGVRRELHEHYPSVPTRLTPNGVDLDRFRPAPEEREQLRNSEKVQRDEVIVLFLGGDWDHKGLRLAIEGLAVASASSCQPLRLWVVGDGDNHRFKGVAQRRGIGGKVKFFGVRTDPERFYQAADIFVLPSLYETFSLAAFEAAASGLPIVTPALSGIDELIGDNDAGIVVDRTAESVAAALTGLAADPGLRARMGRTGQRKASTYTWERSVKSTLAVYRELLSERLGVTA